MQGKNECFDIAVIGAGSAGTMAYLRAVLNNDRTVLFLGDADTKRRAKSTWVRQLDTLPGFQGINYPITAAAQLTLKWLESQPQLQAIGQALPGTVTGIEITPAGFGLHYQLRNRAGYLQTRYVILATGIMEIQPEIAGSIRPILPFANTPDIIYSLEDQGHHTLEHSQLSVIGSTDRALEAVALLAERYRHRHVTVLTHGLPETFSPASMALALQYQTRFHRSPIHAILGEPKAEGLQGFRLENGQQIATDCCVIALGYVVYNELLLPLQALVNDEGQVVVSSCFESSVPGLFAVGNIAAGQRFQLQSAWDSAVTAANDINARLRAARRAGSHGATAAGIAGRPG